MNMEESSLCLGKVGAPHGLKGYMRIQSWTEPKTQIFSYQPWVIMKGNQKNSVVASFISEGKHLIAKLEGIEDRDQAQSLTHANIYIDRNQLPTMAPDEYLLADLIGCNVVNLKNNALGIIEDVVNYGASDIIVVKQDTKTHYIPLISPTTNMIDIEHKTVIVDWDEDF